MGKTETREFSARSQRSMVKQVELELTVARGEALLLKTQKEIVELEGTKARLTARLLEGKTEGHDQFLLGQVVDDLQSHRCSLSALEESVSGIRAQIQQLAEPKKSALEARAEVQSQIAAVIAERLEADRRIDEAVKALTAMLNARAELTGRVAELSASADLDVEDFDGKRFDALWNALPAGVIEQSEAWAAWFLGERKGAQEYFVRDECLVVPETLATHGVYFFGETVELSENEAAELLRGDRWAKDDDSPWRCHPPSVATLSEHASVVSRSQETGETLDELYFADAAQRNRQNEETYGRRVSPSGAPASPLFKFMRTQRRHIVKMRAKGNVTTGGVTYVPGQVFQIENRNAWQLIRAGAAEPLST